MLFVLFCVVLSTVVDCCRAARIGGYHAQTQSELSHLKAVQKVAAKEVLLGRKEERSKERREGRKAARPEGRKAGWKA